MNSRDEVMRATWTLHQTIKDKIVQNIVAASQGGIVKIDQSTLQRLLALVGASADEGYNAGCNSVKKTVDRALQSVDHHPTSSKKK